MLPSSLPLHKASTPLAVVIIGFKVSSINTDLGKEQPVATSVTVIIYSLFILAPVQIVVGSTKGVPAATLFAPASTPTI